VEPEEMLEALEKLDESIEHKLARREDVPLEVKKKLETELRPRLEECRTLVARNGSRAKNVCQDTLVLYREFAFTSLTNIVVPHF
jgi:hypothetical protein